MSAALKIPAPLAVAAAADAPERPAALRIVAPPSPPAARGATWIDLETAARRSGDSLRALRRRCAVEWGASGLARKMVPVCGGKASWHVRDDADAALAIVRFPEQMPFDAMAVSDAQRQIVGVRKRALDRWERMVADYIAAGKTGRA